MTKNMKRYIDEGMLVSYLDIKSIDHPNVIKFVSLNDKILRILILHQYSGIEDVPHVLNDFHQRFVDDQIFSILFELFPLFEKILIVATFDEDYDYLVQQQGLRVYYPYSFISAATKYSFNQLNHFFRSTSERGILH